MDILRPAHNKVAEPVKSWRSIREEAQELREFVRRGKFTGNYSKAFAISQAQVSDKPLRYFVINEDVENGSLKKWFGGWCIMNLRILHAEDGIYWKEACMSFPHREPKNTDRFNKVKVEYRVPFLWGSRKVKRSFKGLPAFVCQHELDHANGINLYAKENR